MDEIIDEGTNRMCSLREWIIEQSKNGIIQHSELWKKEKVLTVGGSSLATIMGINHFSTIDKLIRDRIGLSSFTGDIKTQWGNLFEEVIKLCVEYTLNCEILGEDLFVFGPPNTYTSYSPDGLSVVDNRVILFEFKCPFSRIPNGKPPIYYIPQVKMGLELLNVCQQGLFVEGVYRRCCWDDLADTPLYDQQLSPKGPLRTQESLPIALGFIGFELCLRGIINKPELGQKLREFVLEYRRELGEFGNVTNDWFVNDLGVISQELITLLLDLLGTNVIKVVYSRIVHSTNKPIINFNTPVFSHVKSIADISADQLNNTVNEDLTTFVVGCGERDNLLIGVLPWKLFRLDYHWIEKTPGYLDPWYPKIQSIMEIVKQCLAVDTAEEREKIINGGLTVMSNGGFDDE
jgi:hypothetical protein